MYFIGSRITATAADELGPEVLVLHELLSSMVFKRRPAGGQNRQYRCSRVLAYWEVSPVSELCLLVLSRLAVC